MKHFLIFVARNILAIACSVLVLNVCVAQSVFANELTDSDAEEMADFEKFDAGLWERFGKPARDLEQSPANFQRAIDLDLQNVEALKTNDPHSAPKNYETQAQAYQQYLMDSFQSLV